MKKKRSQWFRVATAGMALNGLEITDDMINKMAANYNPEKYTANINVEHIRGISLNSAFSKLGEVVATKAHDFTKEDGSVVRALSVQIDAYDALIEAKESGQKLGSSIEVIELPENKEPYLFGLAITDTPASFYTQVMEFNLLKKEESHQYSEYVEADFDFLPETKPSFFSTFFSKNKPVEPEPIKPIDAQPVELKLPMEFTVELKKFSTAFDGALDRISQLETKNNELIAKFSVLEKTPEDSTGHPSTNNAGNILLADC